VHKLDQNDDAYYSSSIKIIALNTTVVKIHSISTAVYFLSTQELMSQSNIHQDTRVVPVARQSYADKKQNDQKSEDI
jgi:hypothetical protein